jgi:uncharacterized OB-fold protein
MSEVRVGVVSTYLPAFEDRAGRQAGRDEDAVTMAVEAGRPVIATKGDAAVRRAVVVTRDPALIKGGSSTVLATGLGLSDEVPVAEVLGGAPALLDAALAAGPGTLVIGVDVEAPAGAGAILVAEEGAALEPLARVSRSLPALVSHTDGSRADYDDPRVMRERGFKASLAKADLKAPVDVLAGATPKGLGGLVVADPPKLPTAGASAAVFALAALLESGGGGTLAALEEAQLTVVTVATGSGPVLRNERPALPPSKSRMKIPGEIKFSLPAYDRAFEAKVGLAAGRCEECGTLALPPRQRCLNCGREGRQPLTRLARSGSVHTMTTVHVPVPGLATPYTLTIVDIDDSPVRLLTHLTEAEPGSVAIGDPGDLVLRVIAERDGVPDYGYGFRPQRGAGA